MYQSIVINLEKEIIKRLLLCVGGFYVATAISSSIPPPDGNFPFLYLKNEDEK